MHCDLRSPNRRFPTRDKRCNLWWWLGDEERNPAYSPFRWFWTNPATNFTNTVVGIAHRYRKVTWWKGEGWTWADSGLNFGWSTPLERGSWPRPFVSYRWNGFGVPFTTWRFRGLETAVGWKTSGGLILGMTLRVSRARNTPAKPD